MISDAILRERVQEAKSFRHLYALLGLKRSGGTELTVRKQVARLQLDTSHFNNVSKARTYLGSEDEIAAAQRGHNLAWERKSRSNPENRARWILKDSRKSDRKLKRDNDLTEDFIEEKIAQGCNYCGETQLQLTLDRIDNSKGHTKENVVPCCIRCNLLRRDMPLTAWERIAPAVKAAREGGLFGVWTGQIHNTP